MIQVDGKPVQWRENLSIADLLETLDDVDFCAVVRLNGKLISSPKFDETIIADHSEIHLLPMVAGG